MSQTDNRYQAGRWLLTAEEDLSAVETLFAAEKYAQACFLSQQAGEKAVKALWHRVDADPWGHSIKKLLAEFPNKSELPDFNDWLEKAALLDKILHSDSVSQWITGFDARAGIHEGRRSAWAGRCSLVGQGL